MANLTKDQIRHEIINLKRAMKLLEQTVESEKWFEHSPSPSTRNAKWLKAQTVISGISHCRAVLTTIPPSTYDAVYDSSQQSVSGEQFHDEVKQSLNSFERVIVEASQELKPRVRRPESRLAKLPKPTHIEQKPQPVPVDSDLIESTEETTTTTVQEEPSHPDPSNLLLEAEDIEMSPSKERLTVDFDSNFKPPKDYKAPAFLETSTALQTDLAGQLAEMAAQLKRNAMHFSESLSKDQGVLQGLEEKLESNHDVLTKERTRLRDHRGKSGGTTWIVLLSMVVVLIGFLLTYFVIRIT